MSVRSVYTVFYRVDGVHRPMSDADGSPADAAWPTALAPVFQALANENRLRMLYGVYQGRSRKELVAELPVSESAVSNHWAALRDAGLGYTPSGGGVYALTPFGQFFAVFLDEFGVMLGESVSWIVEAEEQAREENAHLSGEVFEQAVEQRKWELVEEELTEALEDVSFSKGSDDTDR